MNLTLALRNFLKDKNYVLLNILSLAIAISCSLILLSYILTELDYDKHFDDHERIYRIATGTQRTGSEYVIAFSARDLAPFLEIDYSHLIENYVRFKPTPVSAYSHEGLERDWDRIWFADETVFSVFSHEIIFGDPETALARPATMAISQSFSEFYFGDANPVGNVLEAHGIFYEVTLVYRDLPDNTHLKYNALLSANGEEEMLAARQNPSPGGIFGSNVLTYVKLVEGQSEQSFESRMADFYAKIEPSTLAQQLEMRLDYRLQPLASIHYDTGTRGVLPTGNINNLYAFAAILIALIVVSSANYTNLAIAKSIKNAKQIGVTRILGVEGYQLSIRFLAETIIHAFLALLLALCAIELIETLTPLAEIFGRASLYDITQDLELLLWSLGVLLSIALLAGLYPAFYLSALPPLIALNTAGKSAASRIPLQRSLLGIQLFISLAILSTTLLMSTQINYLMDKPLGAEYENLINVKLRGVEAVSSSPAIVNALAGNPGIVRASISSYVLGERPLASPFRVEVESSGFDQHSITHVRADNNFLDVLGLNLVTGRDFSESSAADSDNSAIVNQALVSEHGWTNPLGKILASPFEGLGEDKVVIGVIEDFHVTSLHTEIAPLVITRRSFEDFDQYSLDEGEMIRENLIIKYRGDDVDGILAAVESTIAQIAPSYTFNFEFVEDKVSEQYFAEVNQMSLFGIFALVSISLSCLGIFGLISYTLERRSKELSLRRIVGATLLHINNLLAREYFYLILIVAIPASLISYLVVQDWLSLFSYTTEVKVWIFGVAVAVIGSLAYSVVSIKLLSLARSNLANNLRYE